MSKFKLYSSYRELTKLKSKPLIIGDARTICAKNIFETSEKIEEIIGTRNLVVCLMDNSIDLYHALIALIESANIPMFIDYQINEDKYNQICEKYSVIYFLFPTNHKFVNESFEVVLIIGEYCLLRRKKSNILKVNSNQLAILLPTSGSTGSYKYVRVSYRNLQKQAKSISEYLNLNFHSRTLTTLPVGYSFGFSILNSYLYSAGEIYVANVTPIERKFWEILESEKIRSISGVPYSFELWKKMGILEKKLQYIDTFTQAGGHLDRTLKLEFLDYCDRTGKKFFVMYGQTEATARISYVPPRKLREKIDSIGVPIPGGKLLIRNESGKIIKKPNEVGELLFTGENVTLGYSWDFSDLNSPGENSEFLETGDLGYFDQDGFFYISGRKKRIAKINGHRINLDEIDKNLKILSVSTVTIERENQLYIYTETEGSKLKIIDYFQKYIKVSRNQITIIELQSFPRLSNGKIDFQTIESLKEIRNYES